MLRIRALTPADIPLGMRLKAAAGWNQVEADWRRFLALSPTGCFVAEIDARPVGTAVTSVFGSVAWVAMVLVDPAARGRGVGTALMSHALAHLDARGVRTVRLDATPLGRPIYEKLGFAPEYELARYEGSLPPCDRPAAVEAVDAALLERVAEFDERIAGAPRGPLVRRLFADQPSSMRVLRRGGELRGYAAARPGAHAIQVGPCLATDAGAGVMLLRDVCHRHAGARVFIDVPLANRPAVEWAEAAGLRVQRPLTRMSRGPRVKDDPAAMFATSGPEMG